MAHLLIPTSVTSAYIERISVEVPEVTHRFYVEWAPDPPFALPDRPDVTRIRGGSRRKRHTEVIKGPLVDALRQADSIVVHGAFSEQVIRILLLHPFLLKKTSWVVWGGDLYPWLPERRKPGTMNTIAIQERRYIARHCRLVATLTDGDAQILGRFAGMNPPKGRTRYYNPLEGDVLALTTTNRPRPDGPLRVLVGNSCSPTNNHAQAFAALARFADKPMQVVVPLSYGNFHAYKTEVIGLGESLFGDQFRPLLDIESPAEYAKTLNGVDVGVFAHDRQEGLGTITGLLGLGKKVYSRSDVSSWPMLSAWAEVSDLATLRTQTFEEFAAFSQEAAKMQRDRYRNPAFRVGKADQWRAVFALDGV